MPIDYVRGYRETVQRRGDQNFSLEMLPNERTELMICFNGFGKISREARIQFMVKLCGRKITTFNQLSLAEKRVFVNWINDDPFFLTWVKEQLCTYKAN